jgi:LRR receptor-like serine/threonine-protein kinase FLS2
MTIRGAVSWLLGLCLLSLLTAVALSAPNHPLQVHLTEWKTLPTGERVSCPEKMRRSRMESWDRSATEARLQLWREEFDAMASSGVYSSARRSLVMSGTTSAAEVNALLAFRASILTDPSGALANWTVEKSSTVCSTWKGVTCNVMGQVTGLELQDLALNGTITPRIGDLVHLSLLNLSTSSFSGPLPSQLTSGCQNLSIVDLSYNSLDGEISPQFFVLPKLAFLRLTYNSFSGYLPEVAVNGCQSLSVLGFGYNDISGLIPSSLSRCQKLMVLSLLNNQLNGSIPASLGGLQQLQMLYLMNNRLTGLIPPSLGNCSSLTDLLLGSDRSGFNDLSGTIPEEFGNLTLLVQLGLEYNWKLTGPVIGSLSKCSNLHVLFLGACGFTSIAPEIWSLQNLGQLALFSNKLVGELPLEVGNCTGLEWLDLGWYPNRLTGTIPPTLGKLQNLSVLSLEMNMFTGGIPTELGNLSQLETLWLGRNFALSGPIPREVSSLTTLLDVDLGYSNLTGGIPDNLFTNNPNISRLLLNNNNLTGGLPDGLGKLQSLQVLYLQFNNFSGGIPDDIGGCSSLSDIVLSNNRFNGSILASVGQLSKLEATLDLSQNYFSGNLPVGLGNLTKLQRLILSTNQLNGTIPEDLGKCLSLSLFDLSSNYFTGDIPKFLGDLTKLVSLDLSNNMLDGDVAALSSLSQCSDLETLRIGQNKINGSLQMDFTKWPGLKYFSVTRNQLSGGIPSSFASVNSSLVLVDFSQNGFTGGFPTQVDGTHLSELRVLLFSHNQLEGGIPSWFGNLKSLQLLDLSYNKLTSSIPQTFGNLDGYKVEPNSNESSPDAPFTLNQRLNLTFRGDSVSYSYILLTNTFMDLSSNLLGGEIPEELTKLFALKYLVLSNNKLEGGI